jgi:hypothetical protein
MAKFFGFLFGATLGIGTALYLSWAVLAPIDVISEPAQLKTEQKELYVLMVAMSYINDGDLVRAQIRLDRLGEGNIKQRVTELAERYIQAHQPDTQSRSLAKLAIALGANTAALRVYVVTPTPTHTPIPTATGLPSPTSTPTFSPTAPRLPTGTPIPTRTLTPTPTETPIVRVTYRVFERVRLTCEQDKERTPRGRIMIYVQDANGLGIPGARVRVQWNDGQDTFFTGLKGTDPGYTDFEMQPGKSYIVQILDGTSDVARDLDANALEPECPQDGKQHFRSWRIIFRRSN